MPKDTEEALRRLEQLLEEEEYEETEDAGEEEEEEYEEADESEEDEAVVLSGSGVPVYNADRTDVPPEEYDEIFDPRPRRRYTGLLALLLVLMTAIVLVLLYIILKLKGFL